LAVMESQRRRMPPAYPPPRSGRPTPPPAAHLYGLNDAGPPPRPGGASPPPAQLDGAADMGEGLVCRGRRRLRASEHTERARLFDHCGLEPEERGRYSAASSSSSSAGTNR